MTSDFTNCKSNNVLNAVIDFFFAAVLIVNGNSLYLFSEPGKNFVGKICFGILVLVDIAAFFAKKAFLDKKILLRGGIAVAILGVYLFVFLFANPYNFSGFLSNIAIILLIAVYVFICSSKDNIPQVVFRYAQLITIIAAFSVICWILYSVFHILPTTGYIDSTWYSGEYTVPVPGFMGVYFETQYMEVFGIVIIRNSAIFTEAPMFAWHLLIAFMIELFLKKKTSLVSAIIIAVGIITTISTMGFIFMIGAVLLKLVVAFLRNDRFKSLQKRTKILLIVAGGLAMLLGCVVCFYLMIKKISTDSGSDRIKDFICGFKAWMDHPFFGSGFKNMEAIFMHRAVYSNAGFSNGIMEIAAQGGIWLLIWFVGSYVYRIVYSIRHRELEMLIFAGIVFILAIVNSSVYTYLAYFMQILMINGIMNKRVLPKK